MTTRLIEVDDDMLEAVRSLLGTRTLKATVDDAFNEVLALAQRDGRCWPSTASSPMRWPIRRPGATRGAEAPTDLEAGVSSTSPASHLAMRKQRSAWPFVEMTQPTLDRAVAVQDALAERSRQRGAKITDLLIAAAAEAAGLVVLHYEPDFDLIAEITGQPTEWILSAGSVS